MDFTLIDASELIKSNFVHVRHFQLDVTDFPKKNPEMILHLHGRYRKSKNLPSRHFILKDLPLLFCLFFSPDNRDYKHLT